MKYLLLTILILGLALQSCGKGNDVEEIDSEDPVMIITKPSSNGAIGRGLYLLLSGSFEDDMELKELVASLSYASTKSYAGITDPWVPADEIIPMTGKKQDLIDHKLFEESIPWDCKPGVYRLSLTLEDMAGKSITKAIDIELNY